MRLIRACAEIKKVEIFFSPYLTEEQAVSRWENGDTTPNTETLKLLSKVTLRIRKDSYNI